MLEMTSLEIYGIRFGANKKPEREALKARLRVEIRENTWDSTTGIITLNDRRAEAVKQVARHYANVFQINNSDASRKLREQYAFSTSVTLNDEDMHALSSFIF